MNAVKRYKNIILAGNKVTLRKIKKSDLKSCIKWFSDPEVVKFLSTSVKNITEEQELEWFNFIKDSENDFVFAIISKNDGVYIGNCGLHKIDWNEKNCEFGIFIGNKDYWNKGYGTDALKSLMNFVFCDLKLQKIKLLVYEYNCRAKKVYDNCGFILVDTLKKHHLYNNIYWDTFVMECNYLHARND
jgi:RimJ/RimL family protein N-acetyltransferase